MSPRALNALTGHPESHVVLLLVGLHGIVLILLLRVEAIDISELEEAAIGILTLSIVLDAFQTAIQQRTTHDVQVARQWVHNLYQLSLLLFSIVGSFGQRVVQDFVEASTHQLFADEIGQLMLLVFVALDDEA